MVSFTDRIRSAVTRLFNRARLIRFTRFGTFYILFALAVGAAAINTGNNLLYLILGLMLGLIVISGFLSDSCLWGLEWSLHPLGDLYAKREALFEVRARKNRFPGVMIQLELLWRGQESSSAFLPYVPSQGEAAQTLPMTPARRGKLDLIDARRSTRFPFGLFEKSHRHRTEQSWVVYPAVQKLPDRLLSAALGWQADQLSAERGAGSVPFDLREYRVGEPRKRIHWKSSAKRGRLIVAETERETAPGSLLLVKTWPSQDDVERFITFVASILHTMSQIGRAIGLETPGFYCRSEASPRALRKMLTYLALVNPDSETRQSFSRRQERVVDALALWKGAS